MAVFLFIARRIAFMSPNATCFIPFNKGTNGSRFAGCPVSDSAPMVLPWNAPRAATIRTLPVLRESFNAASLASAPD
ncbi:unannotated protein [freshwater metagenome]|uniref:Unannotated protein n=1 Tax=freshwater metagenome TaxID=449393 RepID=A0A6J6BC93_9ZZZZ